MSEASKAIFGRQPKAPPKEIVPTPEWGPKVPRVEIREIRGDQLELWETRLARGTKKGAQAIHFRAAAIVEAAYVPAEGPKEGPPPGEKIFERDDIKRLAREGGAVLIRLYAAFRRVHGLDEGEDEDPEKNLSEGGQD